LRWLFSRNLYVQSSVGRGFGLSLQDEHAGARLVAMGFWHAPGAQEAGLGALLRHGLALAPFRLGLACTRRMLETTGAVEAQRVAAQGPGDCWYLHNMVVARDRRGSGVGSKLLGRQLQSVVDPSGARARLATQRPENVVSYERLGFDVASETHIGGGEHRFTNWILIRPACSAARG
jgi:GNAT superfamily N-acetyltransferase